MTNPTPTASLTTPADLQEACFKLVHQFSYEPALGGKKMIIPSDALVPLANAIAELLTTYAAQVRRDTIEECALIADAEYECNLSGIGRHGRVIEKDKERSPSWRDGRNLTALAIVDRIRALSPCPVKAAMVPQWQDISTAPNSGLSVILSDGVGVWISFWSWQLGSFWDSAPYGRTPTHWQPLPDPPSPVKAGGETEPF